MEKQLYIVCRDNEDHDIYGYRTTLLRAFETIIEAQAYADRLSKTGIEFEVQSVPLGPVE